jgi:hypothetical protein
VASTRDSNYRRQGKNRRNRRNSQEIGEKELVKKNTKRKKKIAPVLLFSCLS